MSPRQLPSEAPQHAADYIARARELRPLLEAAAPRIEAARERYRQDGVGN